MLNLSLVQREMKAKSLGKEFQTWCHAESLAQNKPIVTKRIAAVKAVEDQEDCSPVISPYTQIHQVK